MSAGRTVVIGVGGGIAAYKACDLARRLRDHGIRVRVAMTRAAQGFVTPLTLQALSGEPVLTDLMDPSQDAAFGHLDLARSAHAVVIVPATADLLAKIAAGFCDDAVTTTVVAARAPLVLCPAMNTAMWENRQVQANVATLRLDPRVSFVGPAEGLLADGDVGAGRLAEVPDIVSAVRRVLGPQDLAGRKVLITAGPTREPLDPVRVLTNPSTGRMGYALAAAAAQRGAQVTLVSGPVELMGPAGVALVRVTTAEEMKAAVLAALPGSVLVIAAAAVSDYRPREALVQKKKKKGPGSETLELVRTPDVLLAASQAAGQGKERPVLVGFAAETEDLVAHARQKLTEKRLDLVVANLVGEPGAGFAAETNEAVLVATAGDESLPRLPKTELAHRILDRAVALLGQRG